jgi:hypothetical protein
MRRKPIPWREVAGRGLLVLLSATLTLALLEAAARYARTHRAAGGGPAETALYTEFDPLLGWRKRGGAHVAYKTSEYEVDVNINRRGLRDPERDYAAPAGAFRVLALGDSYVEGYTVPLRETVTQVLEARLRADGLRAEVLNGGTTGYSTDQEYLFYLMEGSRYRPRVVVLFFFFNDVFYNDRPDFYRLPKPVFDLEPQGLCLRRVPVAEGPPPRDEGRQEPRPQGRSALLEWVEERLWRRAPRLHDRLAAWGLGTRRPRHRARREMKTYERSPSPEIESAWVKTAALLDALVRETRAQGARLLVVHVPNRMEVDDRAWELTKVAYELGDDEWDRGTVLRQLKAMGAASGFPVVDLTRPLRQAEGYFLGATYFSDDEHWTARGHRVAAEEVHRYLSLLGWLPVPGPAAAAPGP